MKAKLLQNTAGLSAGTELEVVDIFCGYETGYLCILPNGNRVSINSDNLEFTDYTPFIDWEQRRYEIAKAVIQGIRSNSFDMTMSEAAEYAIEQADALIEELKKE